MNCEGRMNHRQQQQWEGSGKRPHFFFLFGLFVRFSNFNSDASVFFSFQVCCSWRMSTDDAVETVDVHWSKTSTLRRHKKCADLPSIEVFCLLARNNRYTQRTHSEPNTHTNTITRWKLQVGWNLVIKSSSLPKRHFTLSRFLNGPADY